MQARNIYILLLFQADIRNVGAIAAELAHCKQGASHRDGGFSSRSSAHYSKNFAEFIASFHLEKKV